MRIWFQINNKYNMIISNPNANEHNEQNKKKKEREYINGEKHYI